MNTSTPSNAQRKPVVSVIIPTYNRVSFLKEVLDSIRNQTFTDLEILIVDNNSTDGTKEYVQSIPDSRIRYFRNANNGVVAVNRNFGMRNAFGEFLAFCDDDDLWLPGKLEKQVQLMKEDSAIFLVYSKCRIESNGKAIGIKPQRTFSGNVFRELFMSKNFIPSMTVLIRNRLNDRGYLFNEDRRLRAAEDYDLWLRIARHEKISGIDEALAIYRLHGSNASYGSVTLSALRRDIDILKKHRMIVPSYLFYAKSFIMIVMYIQAFINNSMRSIVNKLHGLASLATI